MKAIISSTYDDDYYFFLPIVAWCWKKLNVDVICFIPKFNVWESSSKGQYVFVTTAEIVFRNKRDGFRAMLYEAPEDKVATYAQCSRLFASALDLASDEVLITSDIDMAVFRLPELPIEYYNQLGFNTRHVVKEVFGNEYKEIQPDRDVLIITGSDLTPDQQFPMCYASGTVNAWRSIMNINGRSYQKCMDDLLGSIDCENVRGNYWCKDQETLWEMAKYKSVIKHRARMGTQFADNRVDRDDMNWRSYLGPDLMDAHLWRPGYSDENFPKILELLQTQYPQDNFDWLIKYRNDYLKLI